MAQSYHIVMAKIEIEIKPCPFCGHGDDLEVTTGCEDMEGRPACIDCANCGASGPWEYIAKKDDVVISNPTLLRIWNQRAE